MSAKRNTNKAATHMKLVTNFSFLDSRDEGLI
jgi:hypothetical protein